MVKASTKLGGSRKVGGALTPARHGRFFGLPHQCASGSRPRRHHRCLLGGDDMVNGIEAGRCNGRAGQGRFILPAPSRSWSRLEGTAGSAHQRSLGDGMVLEAARRAARRRVRRLGQEAHRSRPYRADLVRIPFRSGRTRSRQPRPSPSMRWRWPRRCRASSCRRISLMPKAPFYRAGQNQLLATLFVGNGQHSGGDEPDDLFKVTSVVDGDVAGTLEESGCKMTWPA